MNILYRLKLLINVLRGKYNPVFIILTAEPKLVMDNQLLYGKNVFITGAGQNIGRSIALEMAKQGANIYFLDLDLDKCKKLELELSTYAVQSKGFQADITNQQDIDQIIEYLSQENITIDTLVNNIGIAVRKSRIDDFYLSDWKMVYDTNVFSPLYLTQLVANNMIKTSTKGSIIFITSIHQWLIHNDPSYSSSKAALGMVIKEMAIDLSKFGIRVNGIAPGFVKEDEQGYPRYWQYGQLQKTSIPPKYIGRAVVYLASDYFSRFTTGAVLTVDNGVTSLNFRSQQS
ncbi:SDR family oxidoreductase [Thermosynechococcaceae cyanobacterium BACA0444]|uniref:SDR family oxidoreductase n=1 Tax=Pseudocalidococcus azoricus BACA0444 TaxID=2918990 RepID=A0AAE4FS57_9CYAN|nr:SDR family oxidoreductase [Pseudocalidococcus azoricus]MDS3861155.1 SDR family oxidoreductase [Pseudocalidococcus azoricus BACA0444]